MCSVLDKKIYVCSAGKAEIYDPVAAKWEIIHSGYRLQPSTKARTVSCGNKLCTVNLSGGDIVVHEFNPRHHDWRILIQKRDRPVMDYRCITEAVVFKNLYL